MAGTIPGFCLQRMIDSSGNPLVGGLLYIIQAGTTNTPQTPYQDTGLTTALSNPIICDGNGWLPQFFVANGNIKVRLTDSNGNQQLVADNILVIGPSGSGGGGATVDPTTVLSTGDIKATYGTGTLAGFVRLNGRTIGSATSGSTERANTDCQSLFEYLWGVDSNLVVSGGRGVSAAADWSANKTIALPDWRGRALAALDDMGNTAAGRLTSTYFGTSATVLGAAGFSQSQALSTANLPPYTPSGSVGTTITSPSGNQPLGLLSNTGGVVNEGGSGSGGTNVQLNATSTFTGTAQGGTSTAFAVGSPQMLTTFYIKL